MSKILIFLAWVIWLVFTFIATISIIGIVLLTMDEYRDMGKDLTNKLIE